MTLYLKYRPQTIDELDLASVRENLKNIINSGNIPHAFLFSGPKGTGKTSAARILAKIINCKNLGKNGEPCNKCDMCLSIMKGNNIDIIELDAASNRGIDDIRNLKEGIYLSPVVATKKVYIIDEAHMLTLEAANAFLKTLEEPPTHAIFILATTNPEKLPATVISRLTQIDFTKATVKDIGRQLKRVAKGEKIKINEKAIEKIAKLADGSFRDAVKILENLSFKTKSITEKYIADDLRYVQSFFEVLRTKDNNKILNFVEELVKNGVQIKNFVENIQETLHKSLLAKSGIGKDNLPDFLIEELLDLNELLSNSRKVSSSIIQLPFEIAIIKFVSGNSKVVKSAQTESFDQRTKKKDDVVNRISLSNMEEEPRSGLEKEDTAKSLDDSIWQKILQDIRVKNVSIEALLRAAKPLGFDGKTLKVGVYYKFHKDRLEDSKNTKILEEVCKGALSIESLRLNFELVDRPHSVKEIKKVEEEPLTVPHDKDIIEAAKEIFG